jgi:hypothetical protein
MKGLFYNVYEPCKKVGIEAYFYLFSSLFHVLEIYASATCWPCGICTVVTQSMPKARIVADVGQPLLLLATPWKSMIKSYLYLAHLLPLCSHSYIQATTMTFLFHIVLCLLLTTTTSWICCLPTQYCGGFIWGFISNVNALSRQNWLFKSISYYVTFLLKIL